MSALDTVKNMQAKINRLVEEERQAKEERLRLEQEVALACQVAAEYEEKAEEKKVYDSEAIAELYKALTSIFNGEAGTKTFDDAFRDACEAACLELPPQIKPKEDEEGDPPPNF